MSTGPMDLGSIKGSVELDIANFEQKYGDVDRLLGQLEGRRVKDVAVGADTDVAMRELGALDSLLKGAIDGARAEVDVLADTGKADADLDAVRGVLDRLDTEIASVRVDADTSPAEAALDGLGDEGQAAGDDAGEGMSKGILAGLAAIPLAGGIAMIGIAIGKGLLDGIMDGLQQEVSRDLFSARTGLDAATADKFGRAAGNAYGQAWGESIEANLDTARTALQGGLIDADATTVEVEEIIASLSGVSELLGEDIPRLSRAVGVMMKTEMAPDAQAALDIIVAGMQSGANVSEDLLDTFTEYPAVFERLGLDGQTSMGLISQAMEAGARDTDYAADALKEFQIRATDASDLSAASFEMLGLNAEEMTAQIARGGTDASDGLGLVLDKLRDMEDPVKRNEAAVGLFGTKAEDLGDALYAMDTSTAVAELELLGDVAGRSGDALDTMADNGASALESAKRSIEVSADGIKGALAGAFEEPLADLSTYVSTNRAGVLEFLGGMANGIIDFGRMGVEAVASLIESFGDFIGITIPDAMMSVQHLLYLLDQAGLIEFDEAAFDGLIFGMRDARGQAYQTAEGMRDALITNGMDPLQERFNEGLDMEILNAQVHDASTAAVADIGRIGEGIEDLNDIEVFEDGTFKTASEEAALLDEQLRAAVGALSEVQEAAQVAGESQGELTSRWETGRDALVAQLEAMGFTTEQAVALAEAYGAVPEQIETSATLETAPARTSLNDLVVEVDNASGTVTVNGDPTPADTTLGDLIGDVNASDGTVTINGNKYPADQTLEGYLGQVDRSWGTVGINGDSSSGRGSLSGLMSSIRSAAGSVTVNADTWNARVALQGLINDFSGRVINFGSRIIGGAATGGLAADVLPGFADGGSPQSFTGRLVTGSGTPTSDDVDAKLSRDEFVHRAAAVDYYGADKMYALNAMEIPREWLEGAGRLQMAGGGSAGGSTGVGAASTPSAPSGPMVVQLSPQAEAALLAQADRPIRLSVGRREFAEIVSDARGFAQDRGGR